MALSLKPFNSVGGFSVGEGQTTVIFANTDATLGNITSSGDILGVSNVSATGNILGASITTSGNANISGVANVIGNISTAGILTDNIYYSNGSPYVFSNYGNSNVQDFLSSNLITTITAQAAITGGSFSTAGDLTVVNVSASGTVNSGSTISAAGNITAGSGLTVTNDVTIGGALSATGAVSLASTLSAVGAITTSSDISATGGTVTAASFSTPGAVNAGTVTATGGVVSGSDVSVTGSVLASNTVSAATISATGSVIGATVSGTTVSAGSLNVSGVTSAQGGIVSGSDVSVTGSVVASTAVSAPTVSASGSVVGGTVNAGSLSVLNGAGIGTDLLVSGLTSLVGAVTVNNGVSGAGDFSTTGNVIGANFNTAGLANVGTLAVVAGGTFGSDVSVTGAVSASGAVTGGAASFANVTVADFANVGGNLAVSGQYANVAGNLYVAGSTYSHNSQVTGNLIVTQDLSVTGNLVYTQIENAFTTDPYIILGTGPNGAPLTSDDGLDRAVAFDYYTTENLYSALVWQNSTKSFQLGSNVVSANNIATIESYADLYLGNLFGNVNATTVSAGDVSATGNLVATGNVNAGNINTSGTLNVGEITGNNISTSGNVTAGANIAFGNAYSLTGGTVTVQNVNTNVLSYGTGGGDTVTLSSNFFQTTGTAANIVTVPAGSFGYDFIVKAIDTGSNQQYRFDVSVDNAGDYSIYNNLGASLGSASIIANGGQLFLNIVPANGNAIQWFTQIKQF
jgi:cytoskeletal protein CcmA (bactofilin family)